MKPKSIYERCENCSLALDCARALGTKVVGIDGKDIAEGSRKLTLAILWTGGLFELVPASRVAEMASRRRW